MKKTVAFISLLITCVAMFAQSGPTFPYQAVVRNSQNQLIKDSTFAIDVEVYQATELKYKETQNVTTNANGQFTMEIGGGTVVSGSLNDVTDWSVAKFKITYHLSGGDVVSEQLVHPVPYALQAANAGENQVLTLSNDTIYLTGGSYVKLPDYVLTATMNERLADTLNQYTLTSQLCEVVNNCDLTGNASLMAILNAMDARIDSLAHTVDSLSRLPHGGTPTAFTCGTDSVKDADNNWYHTVQIGGQCWMKENLRTKTHQYGQVWTKTDVDSAIYGRYYDWQAAMQIDVSNYTEYSGSDVKHRGICPEGWHVPSDAEWDTLTKYVYNSADPNYKCSDCTSSGWEQSTKCIAKALASKTGWDDSGDSCAVGKNLEENNATGFSAVSAGYRFSGIFYSFGGEAYFWGATQSDFDLARCRGLLSTNSDVYFGNGFKYYGFSVRCLRD